MLPCRPQGIKYGFLARYPCPRQYGTMRASDLYRYSTVNRMVSGSRPAGEPDSSLQPMHAAPFPAVNHERRTKVALTRRLSVDLILIIRPATACVWVDCGLRGRQRTRGSRSRPESKPSMGGQTWPRLYPEMRVQAGFRAAAR